MLLFFVLVRRGCFRAMTSDFSALIMQLLFSYRFEEAALERSWASFQPRTCSCSEVKRFFSLEHAAVFSLRAKRLLWSEIERLSASNMQLFFSVIQEAAMERNWAIFQPWTCSYRRGCFWSEVERFFGHEHAAVFSLWRRGCFWDVFDWICSLSQ